MIDKSATTYFHKLYELLMCIQVSDQYSTALTLDKGTNKAVEMILSIKSASRKVMLVGNGGSAAIASHMQNDLCKAVGVRAMVFNEAPLLTALSNDNGYECVFEHPIELWANNDDLLLAISSSGQSENILHAVQMSLAKGCKVITFSGFSAENSLCSKGHLNFYVPSYVYGYVELVHSVLAHFLTDCIVMLRSEKEKLI